MIALYGSLQGANVIVRLDSPGVLTDEGESIPTPFLETADFDLGPAAYQGRLRRIAQTVVVGANNTLRVTPGGGGTLQGGQADSTAVVTTDGPEQTVETFPAILGTRFRIKVEVTTYGGDLEIGEADFVVVPRRTSRV